MIEILNDAEVARGRETGALVARILQTMKERTQVGTNLLEIEDGERPVGQQQRGEQRVVRSNAAVSRQMADRHGPDHAADPSGTRLGACQQRRPWIQGGDCLRLGQRPRQLRTRDGQD